MCSNSSSNSDKQCNRCLIFKPLKLFPNRSDSLDKKRGLCKKCYNLEREKRRLEQFRKNPQKYKEYLAKKREYQKKRTLTGIRAAVWSKWVADNKEKERARRRKYKQEKRKEKARTKLMAVTPAKLKELEEALKQLKT